MKAAKLPFRFEVCGDPARLYYVEDGGNRDAPIVQCASRVASDVEAALWARLQMLETQLGAVNRTNDQRDNANKHVKSPAA